MNVIINVLFLSMRKFMLKITKNNFWQDDLSVAICEYEFFPKNRAIHISTINCWHIFFITFVIYVFFCSLCSNIYNLLSEIMFYWAGDYTNTSVSVIVR